MKMVTTEKKYIHTKNFTQNEISKIKKCKKRIVSRMTVLASLLQNTITNIITKIMKMVATEKKYIHTKNFTQNEISKSKKCKKKNSFQND